MAAKKKLKANGRPKKANRRKAPRRLLCILSRKRSLYSTSRLVEAAKSAGHRVIVLDTLRCNMVLGHEGPRMVYRGVEVRGVHSVIPRIGASITGYGLSVVNHFEMMGAAVVNGSQAIARSRDKLRCLQLLSKAGLPIPRTVMARDRRDLGKLVQEIGGLPAIIKLIRGTQGVGVMIAHTLEEAKTMLDTFWNLDQEIVLQEFIAESKGRDVRALVVGDRVVGAMRRQAKKGEFRSNLHRGGEGTPIDLPKSFIDAALRAAEVTGLHVAGVDMLESSEGPKIMEVNSSPGFEGLERATGKNIAAAIVDHAMWFGESSLQSRAGELTSPSPRRLIET